MSESFEAFQRGYRRGFDAAKAPHGLTPDDLRIIDWLLEQSQHTLILDPPAFRTALNSIRLKIERVVLDVERPPAGVPRPPVIPALPTDNYLFRETGK